MAAPPKYAYDIPSLSTTIPGLPVLGNLDFNRQILASTEIMHDNLINARKVAEHLELTLQYSLIPGVTAEMVNMAQLRVRAIEGAHTSAMYGPHDIMSMLATLLQRMDEFAARQTAMENQLHNVAARQTTMENQLHNVAARQAAMENQLHDIAARQTTFATGQATMQTDSK